MQEDQTQFIRNYNRIVTEHKWQILIQVILIVQKASTLILFGAGEEGECHSQGTVSKKE